MPAAARRCCDARRLRPSAPSSNTAPTYRLSTRMVRLRQSPGGKAVSHAYERMHLRCTAWRALRQIELCLRLRYGVQA